MSKTYCAFMRGTRFFQTFLPALFIFVSSATPFAGWMLLTIFGIGISVCISEAFGALF